MAEVRIAPDETSAEIILAPGERLASASLANILLARAGVRIGLDHAALASLAEMVGPVAVQVASGGSGCSVMGRALPAGPESPGLRIVATIDGALTAADGLLQVAGDVHVTGDVGVHAAISALGDVRIDGDLAGGTVAASGRVIVAGAIRRESVVEAAGDVWTTAVEAASIRTDGELEVTGDAVNALVEAGALRVGGTFSGGKALVTGVLAIGRPGAVPEEIVVVSPPRPLALAWARAAHRTEAEGSIARLRLMLGVAGDGATREKLELAIASLEASMRQ